MDFVLNPRGVFGALCGGVDHPLVPLMVFSYFRVTQVKLTNSWDTFTALRDYSDSSNSELEKTCEKQLI